MINDDIKILMLEDNPNDFELIILELDKADFNYTYKHAEGGESFEEYLNHFTPDIVLSDYSIPGYDIFKAMDALKNHNIDSPFILVTGALGDENAVDLIVKKGVDDYILKDNLARLNPAIYREYQNSITQKNLSAYEEEIKKLSLVASRTHNGVIISDGKGRAEWVNDAYTQISGYGFEETIGKYPGPLLQGPKTDPKTKDRIRAKLDAGVPLSEDILNYHKNGDTYWINLNITPVKNDAGEIEKFIAIQEDITERKEAELALEKSFSTLQKAQKTGKIGNWSFDIESEKIYWSDEIYHIYNRDIELGPPSYQEFQLMIKKKHSGTDQSLLQHIEEAIKYGKPYDLEIKLDTEKPKYIRYIGQAVKNEEGEIVGLEGTLQDITESKLAQEKALSKTKQLDDIVNSIEGVLMRYALHPDGSDSLLYVSDRVEELYGISKEEILRNSGAIWDKIHEGDVAGLKKSIEHSAASLTNWTYTTRHFTKDGTLKYLQGYGSPSKQEDGTVIWNTITTDVTDQAIAEQNQNQLQELLNTTLNEVYIVDAETLKIVYCNDSAIINTGYEREELLQLTSLNLLKHSSEDQNAKILDDVPDSGKHSIKTTHTRKDGSTYPVLTQLSEATYKDKPVYIANVLDITELTQKERELEKALAEKDTLIQEINHRVKNNLAIISGLIELQIMKGDTHPQLLDTKNRIHTIAAVHEQLYNTDNFTKIDVDDYFNSLIINTKDSFISPTEQVDINFKNSINSLNINEAIPLGLLTNELITNSVKHAFPNNRGSINIKLLDSSDDMLEFSYSDSGKGFSRSKFDNHDGFGLELINTLISQLTDDFTLNTENEFSLKFKFHRRLRGSYSNL